MDGKLKGDLLLFYLLNSTLKQQQPQTSSCSLYFLYQFSERKVILHRKLEVLISDLFYLLVSMERKQRKTS